MAAVDGGDNPLYQQIANDLRAAIRDRELAPGDQVPTEMDLAQRYGVSRNTARMALNALAHEGLITAGRARAGRLVRRRERMNWTHRVDREPSGPRHPNGLDDFVDQALAQGRVPEQTIEVSIVAATEYIAERLEVPPGENLVVRRRLRSIDGQPSSISDSYYLFEFAHGTPLLDPQVFSGSAAALLAEMGHVQVRFVDEITTRMPDPPEAQRLDVGLGVPVLAHVRTGYTERRPIRVSITILPGDRHKLRYELPD
jgi:GntR family transcriptional regulator